MKSLGARKSFTPVKYSYAVRRRRNLTGFTLVELPVVRKRAFTLVELLIVVVIIGIIAAFIIVNLNSSRSRARDTKRVADLEALDSAINRYYREKGHYPSSSCERVGAGATSSDQVTSMASGDCLSADGYIKGLVPAYISKLPGDSGPQVYDGNGKAIRGFVYIHSFGNNTVENNPFECYKIMVLNPESPKLAGYRSIWDPARDGGGSDEKGLNSVDGTNISAWSKYSRGCAAK